MRDAIEPRVYPWVSIYVYISGSRTVKDIREEDLDKEDVDKRYKRWMRSDTYALMYDVYGVRPNNMGFSENTDFVHYADIGKFNEGVMKTVGF